MAGIVRFCDSCIESCAIPPLRQKQERRKDGAPNHLRWGQTLAIRSHGLDCFPTLAPEKRRKEGAPKHSTYSESGLA